MDELIDPRTRIWATVADLLLELLEITSVVLTSVGFVLLFRVQQRQRDEHLKIIRDLELARESRARAVPDVGFALGSGDSTPESGTKRAFRKTGLQANEGGFGGEQRFPHYGVLFDPALSNLQV